MRRMIEAAELKNQRTIAPEAHSMHLTPDTDPASTFRLRNLGNRPRLDQLQFGTTSPPGSAQVRHRLSAQRSLLLVCILPCACCEVTLTSNGRCPRPRTGLGPASSGIWLHFTASILSD